MFLTVDSTNTLMQVSWLTIYCPSQIIDRELLTRLGLSLPKTDPPLFTGLMPLSSRSDGVARRREERQ